jgi:hypothetical protein
MQTDPMIFYAKFNEILDDFVYLAYKFHFFFSVCSENGFVNEFEYFRFQCGAQTKENWHGWFSAPSD